MEEFNRGMRELLAIMDMDLAELAGWGPFSDDMFHRMMAGDREWLRAVATQFGITVGRAAANSGEQAVARARELAAAMADSVRPMYLSGLQLGLRLHEDAGQPEE